MDSYIDIRLLPDPEFSASTLMNALYGKFHRILVELKSSSIGVSFPAVDLGRPNMGKLMRLHGSQAALERLMGKAWLRGMRDHVTISEIAAVPEESAYILVRRVQAKSSPDRLRRRQMRRHNLTEEEAFQRIPKSVQGSRLNLPYLKLKSQSTNQYFQLFIQQFAPQDHPVAGEFNTYGLSSSATVPWF